MDYDYDLFVALTDCHGELLQLDYLREQQGVAARHDGSAHCKCRLAQWLREFQKRYPDSIKSDRRKRHLERKRSERMKR